MIKKLCVLLATLLLLTSSGTVFAYDSDVPIQVLEVTVYPDGSSSNTLIMPVPPEYESQIDGIIQQYSDMGISACLLYDYQGFLAIQVSTYRDASMPINISTPGSESAAFDAWTIDSQYKKMTVMNASYDFTDGYYESAEEIADIVIHLPKQAKYHNAEYVDGNTYYWTLRGGVNNPIRFIMETYYKSGTVSRTKQHTY